MTRSARWPRKDADPVRHLPAPRWGVLATLILVACTAAQRPEPGEVPAGEGVTRQVLSRGTNDWEPSLALGPGRSVHVSASRSTALPAVAPGGQPGRQMHTVVWSSEDGGRTFAPPVVPAPDVAFQGDARIQTDRVGAVRVTWIGGQSDASGKPVVAKSGLMLATSRDRGRTFDVRMVETVANGVADKPETAVSPDGRDVYIAFDAAGGPSVIVSHDGGQTWARHRIAASAYTPNYWPTSLVLALDGSLWLGVMSFEGVNPGVPANPRDPVTVMILHVFRSTDRGVTWKDHVIAKVPRVSGGCAHDPSCRLKVSYLTVAVDEKSRGYAAYTEGKAKEPYRLLLVRSDDGSTWSEPTVVSAAPRPASGDLADHDYAQIAAAGDGLVYVVWVDDRAGPPNLWATRSSDGGRTWNAEARISRADRDGMVGYYGDYGGLGIDSSGALHVAWGEGKLLAPGAGGESKGETWYAKWTLDDAPLRPARPATAADHPTR